METFKIVASAHSCTELIVETNQLRKYMEKNNLKEVDDQSKADVILVATCAFNQQYEDEFFEHLPEAMAGKKDQA